MATCVDSHPEFRFSRRRDSTANPSQSICLMPCSISRVLLLDRLFLVHHCRNRRRANMTQTRRASEYDPNEESEHDEGDCHDDPNESMRPASCAELCTVTRGTPAAGRVVSMPPPGAPHMLDDPAHI
ncbi:hypothetical protein BDZ89DRAFT_160379 [Hymenopellis radicata]|nr:hypothetical protein BDZ89DRAFT_160379 [Hymenopellis radicata]